ncbi:BTB domain-containing protein [Plasmodiophora brassicae]|uniref:BTB domain-containing protein n=1 Tax=Plasmodiophora brassicae TaxID=37360 RepID=A0A0G4IQR2_PLABS|nr:hypothetical protein PBRA_005802 [Plasmodiophora brassicae]SPQ98232.1 unnamed protein product [Plasmodiophora brassicae]
MTMATYTRPATLPLDDFRATLDPGTGNLDRDAIVRLNVGGERFETRVSTLTDISDTYFAHQLSGRFKVDLEEALFIDRDAKLFRFILNYMRTRQLNVPEGPEYLFLYRALLEEARYFNIAPLIEELGRLIDSRASKARHALPLIPIAKVPGNIVGIPSVPGSDMPPSQILVVHAADRSSDRFRIRFDDLDF